MVCAVNNRDTFSEVECHQCCDIHTIFYNRNDMVDWLSGSLPIQDALHYLSADDRELLLSGICGKCFSKMFPDLDS